MGYRSRSSDHGRPIMVVRSCSSDHVHPIMFVQSRSPDSRPSRSQLLRRANVVLTATLVVERQCLSQPTAQKK